MTIKQKREQKAKMESQRKTKEEEPIMDRPPTIDENTCMNNRCGPECDAYYQNGFHDGMDHSRNKLSELIDINNSLVEVEYHIREQQNRLASYSKEHARLLLLQQAKRIEVQAFM